MNVESHVQGDVTVIALDGSLDSRSAQHVREELERLMPDHGRALLDLHRMSYMSSAGLRVLLLVYRHSQNTGVDLALAAVPPTVHEVLAATGFLTFFMVADTVEDAVRVLTA